MANQVDFKILPSDQFNVYSPQTRSDKIITYFTLLSKLRGDIITVSEEDDPNDIVSAYYTTSGGVQTLHLVKADGSEVTASTSSSSGSVSGTVNYVAKFDTTTSVGDSQIFDDGTNVGIGTTTMNHKLELGTGGVFADYYQLDTSYTNGFVQGNLSWSTDTETLTVGLNSGLKLNVGQDDMWYVKNQTGSTINKGTAVYASGTLGASGRITVAPMIADGTIAAKFFLGITAENIDNGEDGYVMAKGKIRQISTLSYNEGDVLWVSPTVAGGLTSTEPTAPSLKLPVAFVVYKASNGVIAVRATTGTRIADASDVDYTGALDNSFLVYNSTSGVWEDEVVGIFKTVTNGTTPITASSYTDTLTITGTSPVTVTNTALGKTIDISVSNGNLSEATSSVLTITGGTGAVLGSGTTIQVSQANSTTSGYLSSTDWTTFNSKEPALTKGNLTEATSSVLTITGGTNAVIGTGTTIAVSQAGAASDGYLSSADWTTFNSKEPALTKGNLTEATSSVLTITGGTGAVIGSGTSIQVSQASSTTSGYLSSADWTTFNSKQGALTFTAPLVNTSGTITINQSGAASDGYLSSTDWTTFNSKEPALTKGNLTEATSSVLTITGGTGAIIGAGTTIQVTQASSTASGYLSSTDWTTFNGKQNAITLTTTGSSGAATLVGATLNIPQYTDQFTGTVTSVDLTAGTGISVTGGPITTSGSITVTNTAPDQTVVLTAGTGITTSGTYPNFTITNSAPDQTVALTAGTGITTSGTYPNFTITNAAPDQTVVLTAGTGITTSGTYPNFTITNAAPDQTVALTAGTGISVSGTYPNFTITNTAVTSIDCFAAYTSQNLSLAVSGNEYYVEFDNVSISDTSVFSHSTTTNPENITVLAAGRYEISFGFVAGNGNNQIATVQGYISINNVVGPSFSFLQLNTATVGQYIGTALSTYIYDLDANDVINATAFPSYLGGSSGTITVNPSGFDGSTYITIKKIG